MTETVARLLTTIEALPPQERRELLIEMLRRTDQLSEGPLEDDELVSLADEVFQILDADEANDAHEG